MDNKKTTHLIELSNYTSPTITEKYGWDYVTYDLMDGRKSLGKNSYFTYLMDRRHGSTTNGAVISSIVDMIHGEGIKILNASESPNDYALFKSVLKEEDLYRVTEDLYYLGHGAFQVVTKGGGKGISKVSHVPVHKLAPKKVGKSKEVEVYGYAEDWSKVKSKEDIKDYPVFKEGVKGTSILYIKPYSPSSFYFSPVCYQGGLQYCELEEEIGNYHINNIMNGLAPSMLINFNNGVPDPEAQDKIVKNVISKYGGSSKAGKIIVQFNANPESAATIEAIPLSDASEQYQFLSDECQRKILVSHRVTSPLLFGLSQSTGFGSNADELKTAQKLFQTLVPSKFRRLIIESLTKVNSFMGISLDMDYEDLSPFGEDARDKLDELKLSSSNEFDFLDHIAEDAPEGYDLHSIEYDLSKTSPYQLASTANSEQDSPLWKIRYSYQVGTRKTPKGSSRPFCVKMHSLALAGKVFRKEDIDEMSNKGVNGQFAHSGGKYDIFKFAGGVNCHHRWERRIFKKRRGNNDKPLGGNAMQNTFPVNVNEARRQGAKIPKNDPDVAIAEIDKPNKGRYNG